MLAYLIFLYNYFEKMLFQITDEEHEYDSGDETSDVETDDETSDIETDDEDITDVGVCDSEQTTIVDSDSEQTTIVDSDSEQTTIVDIDSGETMWYEEEPIIESSPTNSPVSENVFQSINMYNDNELRKRNTQIIESMV
mgnify:CR=1 FL=1|tara:strand:- start:783 stop:1199 length:417 start_codon:yes stop_codon:yes gene_type:complete